jgi:hypothetical protein
VPLFFQRIFLHARRGVKRTTGTVTVANEDFFFVELNFLPGKRA